MHSSRKITAHVSKAPTSRGTCNVTLSIAAQPNTRATATQSRKLARATKWESALSRIPSCRPRAARAQRGRHREGSPARRCAGRGQRCAKTTRSAHRPQLSGGGVECKSVCASACHGCHGYAFRRKALQAEAGYVPVHRFCRDLIALHRDKTAN